MKTRSLTAFVLLLSPLLLVGQDHQPESGSSISVTTRTKGGMLFHTEYRGELGKWWQNSDIAKKLQLSDDQIGQLDQRFYDHKVKLIDYGAEMEKQDLKLQTLLDADVPNEGQVESQVDQVLTARGQLEREYTLMNLDLRKVLSLDQWRQLKAIRPDTGMMGHKMLFMQKEFKTGPGMPPPPDGLPPLPPGPGGEDIE